MVGAMLEIEPDTPPRSAPFCGTTLDADELQKILGAMAANYTNEVFTIDSDDEMISSPPRKKAVLEGKGGWDEKEMMEAMAQSAMLSTTRGIPGPDTAATFDARVAAGASAGSARPVSHGYDDPEGDLPEEPMD